MVFLQLLSNTKTSSNHSTEHCIIYIITSGLTSFTSTVCVCVDKRTVLLTCRQMPQSSSICRECWYILSKIECMIQLINNIHTYTHNSEQNCMQLVSVVCVCVLCMCVNKIISASKCWHGLLSSLDNPRNISTCLTSNLTHLQGWNKGRKERKKKKG